MDWRKAEHLEACLGYYDGLGRPKLVSPMETGDPLPELTELHEALHADLASSNATDVLMRHLAAVLHLGLGELPAPTVAQFESLLKVINCNTWLVHETYATYLSCRVYHVFAPRRVEWVISRMPQRYRMALRTGELAMGDLSQSMTPPIGEYVESLLRGLATAALNVPLFDLAVDVENLQPFAERIRRSSPDKRFATFLRALESPFTEGVLRELVTQAARDRVLELERTKPFHPDQPYPEIALRVFEALRSVCPHIGFCSDRKELRAWSLLVVDALRTQFALRGIAVMERYEVRTWSPKEDEVERFIGTDFVIPGVPGPNPLDLSLKAHDCPPLRPEDGLERLRKEAESAASSGATLNLFLMGITSEQASQMGLGMRPDAIAVCCQVDLPTECSRAPTCCTSRSLTAAFWFAAPVAHVSRLAEALRMCRAVLKTDERLVDDISSLLEHWQLPVFVLLKSTALGSILDLVERLATRGGLVAYAVPMEGRVHAVVLQRTVSCLRFCAPITTTSWLILRSRLDAEHRAAVRSVPESSCDYDAEVALAHRVLKRCYVRRENEAQQ